MGEFSLYILDQNIDLRSFWFLFSRDKNQFIIETKGNPVQKSLVVFEDIIHQKYEWCLILTLRSQNGRKLVKTPFSKNNLWNHGKVPEFIVDTVRFAFLE